MTYQESIPISLLYPLTQTHKGWRRKKTLLSSNEATLKTDRMISEWRSLL